jgi:hypothetical protein
MNIIRITQYLSDKMRILLRITLVSVIAFIIFLQGGCMLLVVPLEYLYNAGNGEKDLSDDFARGHVIGKEYKTLQEVYLTQYKDSNLLRLEKHPVSAYSYDKYGAKIDVNIYSIISLVPKGVRFRICKVLASTSFRSELCCQRILATLIDDQGTPISINNFQGTPSLIDVTCLFENTFEMPNQDWIFRSKSELIEENK